MADLLTHGCVGLLASRVHPALLWPAAVAGSVLPDLFARVPPLFLQRFVAPWVELPPALPLFFMPFHLPVGMLLSAVALSQLVHPQQRLRAALSMLLGMALHLGVDMLQDHLGVGYALFFPFSLSDHEFPVMGSEDSVRLLPLLLPLTAAVLWWTRSPSRPPPPDRPAPADTAPG